MPVDRHLAESRMLASRLRTHTSGILQFRDVQQPIRFITSDDARIVFPCPEQPDRLDSPVLHIPDESHDSLQLLLSDIQPSASPAARLRWEVYHGAPRSPYWTTCAIESARLGHLVATGDELPIANPLAPHEPALCSYANRHPDRLAAAILRSLRIEVANPVVVGVDDTGMHVRARFDILRLDFLRPATSDSHAREAIDRLLEHTP